MAPCGRMDSIILEKAVVRRLKLIKQKVITKLMATHQVKALITVTV
jgi:hypothetical protein